MKQVDGTKTKKGISVGQHFASISEAEQYASKVFPNYSTVNPVNEDNFIEIGVEEPEGDITKGSFKIYYPSVQQQ